MDNQKTNVDIKMRPTWDEWTDEFRKNRRETMLRLYDNGNGISMTKISRIYGLSRQRVQQIIRNEDK